MTVMLDLTTDEEQKLTIAAAQEGLEPREYLLHLVRQLPANRNKRALRGYGMLARLGATVEEFHHERQEDRMRENREAEAVR